MKIKATRDYKRLSVFIDDKLHLHLKIGKLIGIQSWVSGKNEYHIEYYFKGGDIIHTSYSDRAIWENMLEVLNENIV